MKMSIFHHNCASRLGTLVCFSIYEMTSSIFAAPAGVNRLTAAHPDLEIFVCAVDQKLNDRGYIVPGFGDAGDRQFSGD